MQKIKVNKDIFEALNFIFEEDNFEVFKKVNGELNKNSFLIAHSKVLEDGFSWTDKVSAINEIGLYELSLILEHGYELEKNPIDDLVALYKESNLSIVDQAFNDGIEYTLEVLGIKVKGINE